MADSLQNAVLAFINAKSWPEKKRIVEQRHNTLLSDEIEQVFTLFFQHNQNNAKAMYTLQQHHTLLMHCRQEGIEAAFAGLIPNDHSVNKLDTLLDEIVSLTHPQQMPRRIELCQQALSLVQRERQPELWAALQN